VILHDLHLVTNLRELWTLESFRARIFMAIVPTLGAVFFGYLIADTTPPYIFHKEGSYIVPPQGQGGDEMTVMWKVTHNRTCPGTVTRRLVDPVTDVVLAVYDPQPAALHGVKAGDMLVKTFLLPRTLQSGMVGYQAQLSYTCNWLQVRFPDLFGINYTTPKLLFRYEKG